MRCEEARPLVSAAADAEAGDPSLLEAHLARCSSCRRFAADVRHIRAALRFEVVERVPDIASRVATSVGPDVRPARAGRGSWLTAAAVFLVAALAGAVLAGLPEGRRRAEAALAEQVLAAQRTVETLDVGFSLVEAGWHRDVPERRFAGRLRYQAPERLALVLDDVTTYPSAEWRPNDVTLVVDEASRWTSALRDCPAPAQPHCTPPRPRVHLVRDREPFDEAWGIPLELVTPVASFLPPGSVPSLGVRDVAGRSAVGVVVPAAQISQLLDALRPGGNLRLVHPDDRGELWLDEETMVPLMVRVRAGGGPERQRWAAAHGYTDRQGMTLIDLRAERVRVNVRLPESGFPPPPAGALTTSAGFAPVPPATDAPGWVPRGFVAHRSGTVEAAGGAPVAVWTWADGRAWLKVRSTTQWPGGRLFGDVGELVRPLALPGAGVAYVSEDGRALAVHGDGVEAVVEGTAPTSVLAQVARRLGIVGLPVPAGWAEAHAATEEDARRALPNLLVPPDIDGFAAPSFAVEAGRVTIGMAGAGSRGLVIVQQRGTRLVPPLDPDVVGVTVRGGQGRWSPSRGELEWVERGMVISVRSATVPLPELLAAAEELRAA